MRKHCIYWIWLVLLLRLIFVRAEQQADEHRIQRRFMWQEMSNSVMGSVLGRMFGGARAMKSMFSDLLPVQTKKSPATIDLRPTEMTRVKYIIRNPHTHKPMKIIKMRPSAKKVVKLRGPLPKPGVVTESTSYSLNYDHRMRQLEKEQELIAEGKAPMSSDEDLMDKYFRKKPKGGGGSSGSNEIVTGKHMRYQSWKPVYGSGEKPSSFVTLRPQPLTQLHTDISDSGGHHEHDHDHELLPKPEKLVSYEYGREEEEETENELAKQMGHRYEVTEHTGEGSGEFEAVASMESGFVPSQGYRSQPQHHQEHHQEHHSQQQVPRPRSRGSSTTSTTTSTTEAPNYPPSFLKKYREREAATTRRPRKHHHKQEMINIHHGGGGGGGEDQDDLTTTSQPPAPSFSMSSMRARLQEQQRRTKHQQQQQQQQQQQLEVEEEEYEAALVKAMHGDKWPAEVHQSGFQLSNPIGPSAVAFEQPLQGAAAAAAPAAKYPHPKEHKRPPRANIRERGSIKFGDKPSYEDDEV